MPEADLPSFRVNFSRITLDCWRSKLAPADLEHVIAAIGHDALDRLRAAGPFEWLPAHVHVRIVTAPAARMTPDEFCALWRQCMLFAFEKPLFRSIVQGGLRLFGATPEHFVRLIPRAWGSVARDCGTFEGEVIENERLSVVHWSEIPKPIRQEPNFALAGLGAFSAFYDLVGRRRGIEIDTQQLEAGYVRYLLRW